MSKKNVLDHGFVELVDAMGDDYRILQAARVSTGGAQSKGEKKDRGLIRYLYKNAHMTPFEQVVVTLHVKAPLFVARQWMRHRTGSFNEYSGRYSEMIEDFYTPQQLYYQGTSNHQGSGDPLDDETNLNELEAYREVVDESLGEYHALLDAGVAREQARMVLPVAQYTEFFMTMDLRNLLHFLELRMDAHAQAEIREYAFAIRELLDELYDTTNQRPSLRWTMDVFDEFLSLKESYYRALNAVGKESVELQMMLDYFAKEKEMEVGE